MVNNIMNQMNDIEYGYLDINGIIHSNTDELFSKLYKLQSPQETLKNKTGVCWDQVELERYLFERNLVAIPLTLDDESRLKKVEQKK